MASMSSGEGAVEWSMRVLFEEGIRPNSIPVIRKSENAATVYQVFKMCSNLESIGVLPRAGCGMLG